MEFVKAVNMQTKISMCMYGPAGSGKTMTSLMIAEGLAKRTGKRVAFIDTEQGSDYYADEVVERKAHPEAFDFDAIHTKSLFEVLNAVQDLKFSSHAVLVLDSITHIWHSAIAAWEEVGGAKTNIKKLKIEGIPDYAWGFIKAPYLKLIRLLMDAPFHVIIVGRQKDLYLDGEVVGFTMAAEKNTLYEAQISIKMEALKTPGVDLAAIISMFVEKDRTSILNGRTFTSPTFKTIEPLLRLLKDKQRQTEDPVVTAQKDAPLINKAKTEAKELKDRSEMLFTKYNTEMQVCLDPASLQKVWTELAQDLEFIKEPRRKILRATYKSKQKTFSNSDDIAIAKN